MISKKRFMPIDHQGKETQDPKIDLSHLDAVEWGEELKPKIKEFLEMSVRHEDIMLYIQALTDVDRTKRHWGCIALRKLLSIKVKKVIKPKVSVIKNINPIKIFFLIKSIIMR